MRTISMLLAAFAMIAFPGVAMGQGAGGSDEYSENIPGGGGNQPSDSGGSDGSTSNSSSGVPSSGDGLSEGSTGSGSESGSGGNGGGGEKGSENQGDGPSGIDLSESVATPSSDGSVGEVVGDLAGGSDDGMGLLLPIILGSVLVAATAFVLIRRNGNSTDAT